MNAAEIAVVDRWQLPYADAGHDLKSLFRVGHYRCDRCGAHQIDLSEDLAYGSMTTCRAILQAKEPTDER